MPFIPNEVDAAYARQSVPMAGDFDALALPHTNNTVIQGCAVTPGTGLSISFAAGTFALGGRWQVAAAAANQAITTAHATLDRIDVAVLTVAGVAAIRTGTAAAAPVPPTLTAGDTPLAYVYVAAAVTSIASSAITDKRILTKPNGTIYSAGAASNITAIVTNQAMWTGVTIPANYLAAGQHIRVRAWLYQTTAASPGNLTFRLLYGATVLATSGAVARTASQTGRPILIELDLYVVGTTSIEAQGSVDVNTSAIASARWPMGSAAGTSNSAVVTIDSTTAKVLTLDVTTTVATATLAPRILTIEMYA